MKWINKRSVNCQQIWKFGILHRKQTPATVFPTDNWQNNLASLQRFFGSWETPTFGWVKHSVQLNSFCRVTLTPAGWLSEFQSLTSAKDVLALQLLYFGRSQRAEPNWRSMGEISQCYQMECCGVQTDLGVNSNSNSPARSPEIVEEALENMEESEKDEGECNLVENEEDGQHLKEDDEVSLKELGELWYRYLLMRFFRGKALPLGTTYV
jgi:hypothetical protein